MRLSYEDGTKENLTFKIEYDAEPYGETLAALARLIVSIPLIVGFNLKFDLSWLARYGINLLTSQRIYDCQLAHFILDHQRNPYPSLDGCLAIYGLPPKSSVVEREYWSLGIDTDQIPLEILTEYCVTDIVRTDDLFQCGPFQALLRGESSQGVLCKLHMQDLRVLQEMEFNGLLFDWDGMAVAASEVESKLNGFNQAILEFVPAGFRNHFNTSSGDHLSALLYGGTVSVNVGTPYQHTYKAGKRAGTTETRYRWETLDQHFGRLVEPPEGSELKKKGFYSVDADTLQILKTTKESKRLVEALTGRADLEKLQGTYYHGIPNIKEKYDWQDGYIHGTFNQCRVITGRLSSEKPNQQNRPGEVDAYVITRFQ